MDMSVGDGSMRQALYYSHGARLEVSFKRYVSADEEQPQIHATAFRIRSVERQTALRGTCVLSDLFPCEAWIPISATVDDLKPW